MSEDNWRHRSASMRCKTCMYFVPKQPPAAPPKHEDMVAYLANGTPLPSADGGDPVIGRCRRHAPTLSGWPAIFPNDWCGDHKLDEGKL